MLLIQFTVPQKALEGDIKQKMKHMDWLGGFLSLTMTVCLLVGGWCDLRLTRQVPLSGGGSTFAWGSPVVIALFVVGGCALLAFIFVEGKVASLPLFPGRM
jgi:hypothetical protein